MFSKFIVKYYYRFLHNNPNLQETIKHEKELSLRKQKIIYGVDSIEEFEAIALYNAEKNRKKQ